MTQIAIKYVNPAKDGKKYGNIKDAAGAIYWVPTGMVSMFQPNTTVDVNLSQQTWGQNQVQVVAGFANNNAPQTGDQQPLTPPRPAASGHVNDAEKSGYIFVTGCLQQALSSAKYDTQDIPLLAQALVGAWNDHIKGRV